MVSDNLVDHPLHRCGISDITDAIGDLDSLRSQLFGGDFEVLLLAAGHRDASAMGAEHSADLLPDASGTSSHESDLATQKVRSKATITLCEARFLHDLSWLRDWNASTLSTAWQAGLPAP